MKALCLLILIGWPLTSTAQTASPTVAPDLLIIAYKLGPFVRIDISGSGAFAQLEGQSSTATEINPPRYESQVKAEIKLRNQGARTVKSVDCEFLLTERAGPTTTFRQLTMHVKKAIRPGDTIKVSKLLRGYDLRTWSRRQKDGSLQVRTNIIRIVYADKSVWERGPLRLPLGN
jgi:hypothetical protein